MALFVSAGAGFASRANPTGRPELRAGRVGLVGLRLGQAGIILLLGAAPCVAIAFPSTLLGG
ncbi:hypothetical protein ACWEO4_13845 [Streptomyces sp. NPDC004393]|uniref:hypothetical protein n=1 Tax=unclassified Streptomyces TaxID=2593676 RepID=UPI0033AC8D89